MSDARALVTPFVNAIARMRRHPTDRLLDWLTHIYIRLDGGAR